MTTQIIGNQFLFKPDGSFTSTNLTTNNIITQGTNVSILTRSSAYIYNPSVTGTNMAGQLYFELMATGPDTPVLDDNYVEVTFSTPYTISPIVMLTPASADAGDLIYESSFYVYSTESTFTIACGNNSPSTSKTYYLLFNYMVIGTS